MNNFINVGMGNIEIKVAQPLENIKQILELTKNAKDDYLLFSELCITGYTCGDLFFQKELLNSTKSAIKRLLDENSFKGILIVGAPIIFKNNLYNTAIVIQGNDILGIIPKFNLANNREFQEKRYFKSGYYTDLEYIDFIQDEIPFGLNIFENKFNGLSFGVEICEDLWSPFSPSALLSQEGCEVVFNLSASPEILNKSENRLSIINTQSLKNKCLYIYNSNGHGESASETSYSSTNVMSLMGKNILNKQTTKHSINSLTIDLSKLKYEKLQNQTQKLKIKAINLKTIKYELEEKPNKIEVDRNPFNIDEKDFETVINITEIGLLRRLNHIGLSRVVIGISGGLDSTYTLLVVSEIFKRNNLDSKNIICVTMPGFGTSDRTLDNALNLMKKLNVTQHELSINELASIQLKQLNHEEKDVVYENIQARTRTSILMNLANKEKAIVLGTSDLSELCLGFTTFNGDHMSMFSINSGLPKTSIRSLVKLFALKYKEINELLIDIVDTKISPELIEDQDTEELIGTYQLNDFIIYRFLSCGEDIEKIEFLVEKTFGKDNIHYVKMFFKRFFNSQFKRSAVPDSIRIFDLSLSPRTCLRIPSDVKYKL